jgi:cytochrome P450
MIFDAPLFDNAAARVVRARLPGERGLPLVGETLRILKDPVSTAVRLHQKHGPVYWSNAFGMTSIVVSGPEALRAVFTDPTSAYSNGQAWEFYIGKFFERGLMLLDFAEHKFHRGVMQTAFKRQAIERYFQSMQPTIARAVSGWPSGEVRVAKRLKQLTLDVAIETFMGERPGPEADAVNVAFVDTVRAGTAFIRHPVPFGRWGKGLRGRQVLERFIRTRIPKKRASPSHDLFSRLCEATDAEGNRFTDDDIVNHMIFLMMAAHDTSTITLTSLLYQLARHPAWQERLRNELSALPAGGPHPSVVRRGAQPGPRHQGGHAPAHAAARHRAHDHQRGGPARAPDPRGRPRWRSAWPRRTGSPLGGPRPKSGDPDRFGPERAEHRKHPFLFSPFGGGAHKCIGMHFGELEIRSVVHHVLSRFRLSVPRSYELPVDYTSLPVAADGLPMRLDRISA